MTPSGSDRSGVTTNIHQLVMISANIALVTRLKRGDRKCEKGGETGCSVPLGCGGPTPYKPSPGLDVLYTSLFTKDCTYIDTSYISVSC